MKFIYQLICCHPRQVVVSCASMMPKLLWFLCLFSAVCIVNPANGFAQSGLGIAAIVNDEPISQFDISERIKLNKILGERKAGRKQALQHLVEEQLQRQEGIRLKMRANPDSVKRMLGDIYKRNRTTKTAFTARLKKSGVKIESLKKRIEAILVWRQILRRRFGTLAEVDEKDIDRAFERAKKKRRPAQHFYMLQQIILPFSGAGDVQGRQIEAQRIIRNFKGCRSTKRISRGIYNVKIRNIGPIPANQLQAKLRKLIRKAGPGKLLPPTMSKRGIELLAYCSNKSIAAQEVTRDQVKAGMANQQIGLVSTRHLRDLKRDAIIDYR